MQLEHLEAAGALGGTRGGRYADVACRKFCFMFLWSFLQPGIDLQPFVVQTGLFSVIPALGCTWLVDSVRRPRGACWWCLAAGTGWPCSASL